VTDVTDLTDMGRDDRVAELLAHASALGVETGYWDVQGTWHPASVESVVAVLGAMGAPVSGLDDAGGSLRRHVLDRRTRALGPVVTVLDGGSLAFELCLPEGAEPRSARVDVGFEGGDRHVVDVALAELQVVGGTESDGRRWERRRVELSPAVLGRDRLEPGYHTLSVELAIDRDDRHEGHEGRDQRHDATLLVAPDHVVQPGPADRLWGVVAPTYSLRTELGIGADVTDLDVLGAWIDGYGGKVIGTLPLLATYLDEPCDPSPYAPVSRRFWNEVFLDVERLPEMAGSAPARARLDDPATQAEIAALRRLPQFDAARQCRLVTSLLDDLTTTFFAQPVSERAAFDRWVADHPLVIAYGRFRAAVERQRAGWREWPERTRGGLLLVDDFDRRVAARHVYAQWSMHRQLGQVSAALDARGQALYLDLPVGSSGEGFDTWIDQPAYGWGASVGAPPDDFFEGGQDWGFPPVRPDAAREDGHRLLAECLRHHMAHAGILRLDHVMGLHRLFWVPDGMDASQGVYVRNATEEQFAVVAIESQRAGCIVVGEDLGTVPDEVRAAMDRHRVLRSYVAEFAVPDGAGAPLGEPDHRMVATVTTHDTPTFAAFAAGADLDARREAGHLDAERTGHEQRARQQSIDALVDVLGQRGYLHEPGDVRSLLRALVELLGDSESPAVLVSLDDLLGTLEPQNVPGTPPDRPNWVLRLPGPLTELASDPAVGTALAALQARRLASYGRAGGGRADLEATG
jgi:4-alpha-glucanotransferase